MTEQQIQQQCFIWFWNTYPDERQMLFHVDNNSANRLVGNQKKSLGVTKGVSDFVYLRERSVVLLECKTDTGQMSAKQKEFMNKVQQRGHIYDVFRSLEEFQQIIRRLHGQG